METVLSLHMLFRGNDGTGVSSKGSDLSRIPALLLSESKDRMGVKEF
jgi:hypothetical protein